MKIGFLIFLFSKFVFAQVPDFKLLVKDTKELLGKMVAANTSNPPGNESKIVKILSKKLDNEKIHYLKFEFAPGRQSLVARLKGSGKKRPLLLLAHLDVVGTNGQNWTVPQHRLTEKADYLYGRGTSDDLGRAAVLTEIFIALHKTKAPLNRDIILALTADEEVDGMGIQEIMKKAPQLLDAEIAINEGGAPFLDEKGKVRYLFVETAEKTYQDFLITAKGISGHSSVPVSPNAIYELSSGLSQFAKIEFPERRSELALNFLKEREKTGLSMKDPAIKAILRTTCVPTILQGGTKENALPASASVNINCRIFPGESYEDVLGKIQSVFVADKFEIKPVGLFQVSQPSPTSGVFFDSVRKVSSQFWPEAPVIPGIALGASDSVYLRRKGIHAYGLSPLPISEEDDRRAHGEDERIPAKSVQTGLEFLHALILELTS